MVDRKLKKQVQSVDAYRRGCCMVGRYHALPNIIRFTTNTNYSSSVVSGATATAAVRQRLAAAVATAALSVCRSAFVQDSIFVQVKFPGSHDRECENPYLQLYRVIFQICTL